MFAKYVADGLQGSFCIGFNYSSPLHSAHKNHPSSGENPAAVVSHMHQELQLGRMSGPISANLIHNTYVSPIGLVPKPHSNKLHLIVDLSFPADSSVNDGISSSFCSLQYASVNNEVEIIMCLGCCTELVKMDLLNAYRIVPVHLRQSSITGNRMAR